MQMISPKSSALFANKILLILLVHALELLLENIMRLGLHLLGLDRVALEAIDRGLHSLGAELLVVDAELFERRLDQRELVGVVVNHELLGKRRALDLATKQPARKPSEKFRSPARPRTKARATEAGPPRGSAFSPRARAFRRRPCS